jgi:hypothetical protein
MHSILPNFEYDIFISYRHNDNLDGSVTNTVQNLERELKSTIKDSSTSTSIKIHTIRKRHASQAAIEQP